MAIAALCALILAPAAGCYWFRYREIAATHLEIIERMALDAREGYLTLGASTLTPSDLKRLAYPHERAVRFLEVVAGRRPDSRVLGDLTIVVEHYGQLVAYLDTLRGQPPDPATRERVVFMTDDVVRASRVLAATLASGAK